MWSEDCAAINSISLLFAATVQVLLGQSFFLALCDHELAEEEANWEQVHGLVLRELCL